jgi:hypothetical protein
MWGLEHWQCSLTQSYIPCLHKDTCLLNHQIITSVRSNTPVTQGELWEDTVILTWDKTPPSPAESRFWQIPLASSFCLHIHYLKDKCVIYRWRLLSFQTQLLGSLALVLNSGDPGFKSRLSRLGGSMVFLSPSKQVLLPYLKRGRRPLLSESVTVSCTFNYLCIIGRYVCVIVIVGSGVKYAKIILGLNIVASSYVV